MLEKPVSHPRELGIYIAATLREYPVKYPQLAVAAVHLLPVAVRLRCIGAGNHKPWPGAILEEFHRPMGGRFGYSLGPRPSRTAPPCATTARSTCACSSDPGLKRERPRREARLKARSMESVLSRFQLPDIESTRNSNIIRNIAGLVDHLRRAVLGTNRKGSHETGHSERNGSDILPDCSRRATRWHGAVLPIGR